MICQSDLKLNFKLETSFRLPRGERPARRRPAAAAGDGGRRRRAGAVEAAARRPPQVPQGQDQAGPARAHQDHQPSHRQGLLLGQ